MCCMTSDFANIGHTTFTLVSELHRFLFPRELKQSQKSRSVIRGLKAGNSVLIITPGVPCVIVHSSLSSSTNGFGSTILPEYVMCLIYDGK